MPSGSSSARSFLNSASRGYICVQHVGGHPRVLGQVHPAAGLDDQPVERAEQRGQSRRARREVERERPAGHGERQQPGVTLAEPLQHGHEGRRARAADQLDDRRTAASWPNGTTYWYWRNPPGP